MPNETEHLTALMERNDSSGGWHGPSLSEILDGVDAKTAFAHPAPNLHSIWELVEHIIAWRLFAVEMLKDNAEYTIPIDSETDWKTIEAADETAWQSCLRRLAESSVQLKQAIGNLPLEKLDEAVPSRPFPFFALLHGVLHHDIYHAAQISLLKKMSGPANVQQR